ncbi:unnamed protein product [Psylliodes chrysocephalus]|uniref:Uncharacterized protein n=1 Tax=Psylliodes chrysocephalus TaxID=3402493 RepID=A0A9P0D0X6_9CUCU|nr:unnamed protein product [Psylliodes chrysocephala]
MQTNSTPYAEKLYSEMTTKFPELRIKTVQNILDQRRQLFIKNRLDQQVIRNIRAEVELELGITPTQEVEPDGRNRHPPQNAELSAEDQEALDALKEALDKYSGMDPASRPNIPKIRNDRADETNVHLQKNTKGEAGCCHYSTTSYNHQDSKRSPGTVLFSHELPGAIPPQHRLDKERPKSPHS